MLIGACSALSDQWNIALIVLILLAPIFGVGLAWWRNR